MSGIREAVREDGAVGSAAGQSGVHAVRDDRRAQRQVAGRDASLRSRSCPARCRTDRDWRRNAPAGRTRSPPHRKHSGFIKARSACLADTDAARPHCCGLASFEISASGRVLIDRADMTGVPPYRTPGRHDVPVLCALPAPVRGVQRRLRPAPGPHAAGEIKLRVRDMLDLVKLGPFATVSGLALHAVTS